MALVTPSKLVKLILSAAFICMIVLHIKFWESSEDRDKIRVFKETTQRLAENPTEALSKDVTHLPPESKEPKTDKIVKQPTTKDDSESVRHEAFNESLSYIIRDINKRQLIRNQDSFPTNINGTYDHMFVVQVHDRDHYFQSLIASLKTVQGVNKSLLVVSHDYYSKEIFDLVEGITFMPVLQIFYPLAMQLYHDRYPGPDPNDCPRDIKKSDAIKSGCMNAQHPDLYGHYREAKYSQTKLHWFWKLQYVFDKLTITKKFNGYITLIEEDHYLTPDALYMLNKMIDGLPELCSKCRILTLGNYDKKPTYSFTSDVVATPEFISSKHNMAMSLNRSTYELIKQYSKDFCSYDDYNWDWSLQHIGKNVIPGKLPTLIVKTPRVYHIGECGVHHKGKRCDPQEKINPILRLMNSNPDKMFPATIKLGTTNTNTYLNAKKMKANGGWGDTRDHDLCLSFVQS